MWPEPVLARDEEHSGAKESSRSFWLAVRDGSGYGLLCSRETAGAEEAQGEGWSAGHQGVLLHITLARGQASRSVHPVIHTLSFLYFENVLTGQTYISPISLT